MVKDPQRTPATVPTLPTGTAPGPSPPDLHHVKECVGERRRLAAARIFSQAAALRRCVEHLPSCGRPKPGACGAVKPVDVCTV
jgi:hypothetical protein